MTREIALAIDPESEEAGKTVSWAKENFLRKTDHVNLITVLCLDAEFVDHDYLLAVDEKDILDMEEKLKNNSKSKLEKFRNVLNADGIPNVSIVLLESKRSDTCKRLIEHLGTVHTDCLILGSRNLSSWKRLIIGSFSDYIQSHVRCSVLLVK
ncbi:hypothetical protein BDC45DRAFT_539214 [Circinella umbellata]|nr:hypothetical protein BDC45DRAFT_539214 [Circinella umbellata]